MLPVYCLGLGEKIYRARLNRLLRMGQPSGGFGTGLFWRSTIPRGWHKERTFAGYLETVERLKNWVLGGGHRSARLRESRRIVPTKLDWLNGGRV